MKRLGLAALLLSSCSYTPKQPVLIVGDSLTVGAKPYLEQYCPGAQVVASVGKGTSWMYSAASEQLAKKQYGTVFVLGGINDATANRDAATVQKNLDDIAALAKAHGAQPVFGTILPFKGYAGKKHAWSQQKQDVIASVNQHIKNYTYVDTNAALRSPYDPLMLANSYLRPGKHNDYLHLGKPGLEKLALTIANEVCR